MTELEECVYDYLLDKVKKMEYAIECVENEDFTFIDDLPSLPRNISYRTFIDKLKEIAEDIKEE